MGPIGDKSPMGNTNPMGDVDNKMRDENGESDLARADDHYAKREYEQAIAAWEKAERRGAYGFSIFYKKAQSLRRLRRYEEAVASLEKALEVESKNADAWNTKGLVLMELNSTEEAQSCFEKATALQPANQNSRNNLQEAQEGTEKKPEKTIEFEK